MADDYEFTNDWFARHGGVWKNLLQKLRPNRLLEIGSFEGRSACFAIEICAADRDIELHCVDTWGGGVEHAHIPMHEVERRFERNVAIARARAPRQVELHKHKALSSEALVKLLAEGQRGTFDLIYVDGSHQAPDVLADAVLAFMLLKVGGYLIFDDYIWSMGGQGRQDFYQLPKPAIDAFVNIYQRKLAVAEAPLYQLYVRKTSD